MKFRSIILIDGSKLINESYTKTADWIIDFDISNKTDINKVFLYNFIISIIDTYKNNKSGFIIFYFNDKDISSASLKNLWNKFKKLQIPYYSSNISFLETCNFLNTSDVDYDELLLTWKSAADVYNNLVKFVKKMTFKKLHKTLVNNIAEAIAIIS